MLFFKNNSTVVASPKLIWIFHISDDLVMRLLLLSAYVSICFGSAVYIIVVHSFL